MSEALSAAQQENVLAVLCFNEEHAKLVRNAIDVQLFDNAVYRDIAKQASDYLDRYGTAPGEHIADLLEDRFEDESKGILYQQILDSLYEIKDSINTKYVIDQLKSFVDTQHLKIGIQEAVEAINNGDIDAAKSAISKSSEARLDTFERGSLLADMAEDTTWLDELDDPENRLNLGIDGLDQWGLVPQRQQMFLYMGKRKSGKSWFMIHVAKMAVVQNWKALVITLEMSEKQYKKRIAQSLYSMPNSQRSVRVSDIEKDEYGEFIGLGSYQLSDRPALNTSAGGDHIRKKSKKIKGKLNSIVKEFPQRSLTAAGLKAYMDGLEQMHGFVPDVLIIDYPDIMSLNPNNLRLETSAMYSDLRGIAQERNCALVVASQTNRDSDHNKTKTDSDAAEDISKVNHSDTVVTYNQTQSESKLGLARLYVAAGRHDRDKFSILISQAYDIGQFCLDSVEMPDDYWDIIDDGESEGDDE